MCLNARRRSGSFQTNEKGAWRANVHDQINYSYYSFATEFADEEQKFKYNFKIIESFERLQHGYRAITTNWDSCSDFIHKLLTRNVAFSQEIDARNDARQTTRLHNCWMCLYLSLTE